MTRYGVTQKRSTKRLNHARNLLKVVYSVSINSRLKGDLRPTAHPFLWHIFVNILLIC